MLVADKGAKREEGQWEGLGVGISTEKLIIPCITFPLLTLQHKFVM